MYIKSVFIPSLKIKRFKVVEENDDVFKAGVVDLCNILKKDIFVVQVFAQAPFQEPLIRLLGEECKSVVSYKQFNFYTLENVDFFKKIDLDETMFLRIISLPESEYNNNPENIFKAFAFYLDESNEDYTQMFINFSKYDEAAIEKLNSFKKDKKPKKRT